MKLLVNTHIYYKDNANDNSAYNELLQKTSFINYNMLK